MKNLDEESWVIYEAGSKDEVKHVGKKQWVTLNDDGGLIRVT